MKKSRRDTGGTEGGDHAGAERRAETGIIGEEAERRRAEAERHVEKRGVGAHREPAALRRHEADRFNPEPGINERVAEPGQRGSGQRQRKGDLQHRED